jgi:hypothetical protein
LPPPGPVNINPNSTITKSVLSINQDFQKSKDSFNLDDLRLPGHQSVGSLGLPAGQNQDMGNPDFLNQLNQLDLDHNAEQVKENQEEQAIRDQAQQRFENHQKSKLNPFTSQFGIDPNAHIPNMPLPHSTPVVPQNLAPPGPSNLAFSNMNPSQDKTIQDVNLPSFAKDDHTPQPSMNLGVTGQVLDKAPKNLPLNMNYVSTQEWDKDQYNMGIF